MTNKSRRENVRPGESPFGVTGLEMEARRSGRIATTEVLKRDRTPLAVVQIAEKASETAERALALTMATSPPAMPSACQPGCAWCCYKTVGTAAPEVLRIADYLRTHLSPEALQATVDRIIRFDDERRLAHPDKRSKARPCSLLRDNQCIAYAVRPLTCRGFNSTDARKCEQSLDPRNKATVPAYQPQQRLYTLVLDGVRSGLSESGLSGELLELTGAMRIALTSADAKEKWLAGQNVFATARLD
jgi:Fe-S-cluster containining protein